MSALPAGFVLDAPAPAAAPGIAALPPGFTLDPAPAPAPAPSAYQTIEGGLRRLATATEPIGSPETAGRTVETAIQSAKEGFGSRPLGITPEDEARYPVLKHLPPRMKELAAGVDLALRAPGAVMGGLSGEIAGLASEAGYSGAPGRLAEDINLLMQGGMIEGGMPQAPRAPTIAEATEGPVGPQVGASNKVADFLRQADIISGRKKGEAGRAEIDEFLRQKEAGAQPAPANAPQLPAPATEPAPAAVPPAVSPRVPAPPSLDDMLNDPRSAEEIRADLEATAKAARDWQITPDWQEVPLAVLQSRPPDPTWEVKTEGDKTLARIAPTPGTRDAPVPIEQPADVHAGLPAATPTPAQAEAGNYQKRHVQWQGHDIAIETEAGGVRSGVGGDGKPWSVTLPNPYGYIKRSKGNDGDQVDITLGPQPKAPTVFVVDQIDPATGKFDEHKTFAGFPDEQSAVAAYQASFSDGSGPDRLGHVTPMSVPEFTQWVKTGNMKRPLGYKPAPVLKQIPAQPKGPQNLLQFLAAKGGLKLDQGGELRSLGIGPQTRIVVPGMGFRNLVRPNGLEIDKAREMAVEAGYLHDPGWNTELPATTTPDDLIGLIREGVAGRHTFTADGHADMAQREQARQAEIAKEREDDAESSIRDFVKAHGLIASDAQIREALDLAMRQGGDPVDAIDHVVERDAIAKVDEWAEAAQSHAQERPDVPQAVAAGAAGEGEAGPAVVDEPARPARGEAETPPSRVEPDQAREPRPESGERQPEPAAAEPERPAAAVGEPTRQELRKKKAAERAATEATPAGEQAVIPGAEKIGQGEQAQIGAEKPLKPKVAQKPPDQGLFGDESQQTDLIDRIPKAPETGPSSFEPPKSMTTAALIDLRSRVEQASSEDRGAISRWLEDQFDGFAKEGARIAQACLEQGGGYSIR